MNGVDDLLDFLLKRYSAIDYVMDMNHVEGISLIVKALENDQKERLFQQWLSDPARYEVDFDDYVRSARPYRKSTVEEKESILKRFGGDS